MHRLQHFKKKSTCNAFQLLHATIFKLEIALYMHIVEKNCGILQDWQSFTSNLACACYLIVYTLFAYDLLKIPFVSTCCSIF